MLTPKSISKMPASGDNHVAEKGEPLASTKLISTGLNQMIFGTKPWYTNKKPKPYRQMHSICLDKSLVINKSLRMFGRRDLTMIVSAK